MEAGLAKYSIEAELRRGSFGCAMLARRGNNGEKVVIEQINLQPLSPKEQKEVEEEVALLPSLNHRNLVAFLDDVKLIAANALSYNQGTSIIYRRAKKLKSEAISLVHSFRMEVCAHEAVYVLCISFLCDLFRNVFFLSHAPTPP